MGFKVPEGKNEYVMSEYVCPFLIKSSISLSTSLFSQRVVLNAFFLTHSFLLSVCLVSSPLHVSHSLSQDTILNGMHRLDWLIDYYSSSEAQKWYSGQLYFTKSVSLKWPKTARLNANGSSHSDSTCGSPLCCGEYRAGLFLMDPLHHAAQSRLSWPNVIHTNNIGNPVNFQKNVMRSQCPVHYQGSLPTVWGAQNKVYIIIFESRGNVLSVLPRFGELYSCPYIQNYTFKKNVNNNHFMLNPKGQKVVSVFWE